jgi:hypothetical protein
MIEVGFHLRGAVKDSELLLKLPLDCGFAGRSPFEETFVSPALKLLLCLRTVWSSHLQFIVIEFFGYSGSLGDRYTVTEQLI